MKPEKTLNNFKLLRILFNPLKVIAYSDMDRLSSSALLPEGKNQLTGKIITMCISLTFIFFLVWSSFFKIDEVTFSPGVIKTTTTAIKVQSVQTSNIDKIFVQEGQNVNKGDPLLRLDTSALQAEYDINIAKKEKFQMKIDVLNEQLKIRKDLFEKGLNSKVSVLSTELQQKEAKGNLDETLVKLNSLEKEIEKRTLFSQVSGYVHNFTKKSIGDVANQGETLLEIIPSEQNLIAEVKISPDEIGQVAKGQGTILKFNTYEYSNYGGVTSELDEVSPTTIPEQDGTAYYKGIIKLPESSIVGDLKVIPGMTLIAEIKTGQKSLLDYLLSPILESADKSFTEK